MRIFCHAHKRSFLAAANTPILCEKGQHTLGAVPGDPAAHDYWEYCCSCQNFWRVNTGEPALAQCPVCERDASARFLCSNCDTLCIDSLTPAKNREVYLSLNGTPVPYCPACKSPATEAVLDHDCETLQQTVTTSRPNCPFCNEKIASASLSFPASVASFLDQYSGDKLEVSFDPHSRQLIKANRGDFVLLSAPALPAQMV